MALNPNIALSLQTPDLMGSFQKGQQAAMQNRLAQLQIQQAETDAANKNRLAQLMPGIAKGDQAAVTEGLTIDPQQVAQVQGVVAKMDERQRTLLNQRIERGGKAIQAYTSLDPQQQAQQWPQFRQYLAQQVGFTDVPEQPDPLYLRRQMAEAGVLKDALAGTQPSFGQPVRGVDRNGQPVLFQTDKAGNVRVLQDVQPPPDKGGLAVTLPDGTTISAGGGPLTTKTRNDLQERKFNSVEALSRLNTIGQEFKPEYLELGTRWNAMATSWKEKAGFKPDPQDQKALMQFSKFKRAGLANVNRTVKEITGAAMTDAEAKRIMAELPNPGSGLFDGDSPTEFKAKLDSAVRDTKRAIIRANYASANNLDPLNTGIELSDVDALIDRRGTELEQVFKQQNPNAAPEVIQMQVRDQIAREFGLE